MNDKVRVCSRCKEFKSLTEFYKQGERYESFCKSCKRTARTERRQGSALPEKSRELCESNEIENLQAERVRSYEDLGFTKEEFMELADFFEELLRLHLKKG